MKNLNYLNTEEINEFNIIKNSKKNLTRARLQNLTESIINRYALYLTKFDEISKIEISDFTEDEKKDLNGCYFVKTKARNDILKRIIDNQTVYFKHICPYCLYYIRSTYDHYVPEDQFPEYSILIKNLIPCCSTCNSKKNDFWKLEDKRKIIHFYNDLIPQSIFLKATITVGINNIPSIKYFLNKPVEMADDLFDIVEGHYLRLGLCELYNKNLDIVISTIVDDINNTKALFETKIDHNKISEIILQKSATLKINYGVNYWQSVAMDLLASTPEFINNI